MILQEIADLMDIGVKSMGKEYKDIRICELGDQRMKWNQYKTGKRYYTELKKVIEHISIDINGKNGALPLDLNVLRTEWKSYFDICSNYGMTEHIQNQYMAFYNLHSLCKIGGVTVHANPIIGGWKTHCPYHYEKDFFEALAKVCGYEVILSELRLVNGRYPNMPEIDRTLVCAVLKKTKEEFISKDVFDSINKIDGWKG